MYKTVILKAFEKAKREYHGIESQNAYAMHISEAILDAFNFSISPRTLLNRYKDARNCKEDEDIRISSSILLHLCKYLGYSDYNEYVLQHPEEAGKVRKRLQPFAFNMKQKFMLVILILGIVLASFYFYTQRQRWMIWNVDHYIEVAFDAQKLQEGELKLYSESRILNFKKIQGDCNTEYFDTAGNVKVWYGKNAKKELELFTALGLHPETGKTLKPITGYMVRKYLCNTYAFNK